MIWRWIQPKNAATRQDDHDFWKRRYHWSITPASFITDISFKSEVLTENSSPTLSEVFILNSKFLKFSEWEMSLWNSCSKALIGLVLSAHRRIWRLENVPGPKSLVRGESKHFERALRAGLWETTEQKCTLLEEDPQLFAYFVEYLYREIWLYDIRADHSLQ